MNKEIEETTTKYIQCCDLCGIDQVPTRIEDEGDMLVRCYLCGREVCYSCVRKPFNNWICTECFDKNKELISDIQDKNYKHQEWLDHKLFELLQRRTAKMCKKCKSYFGNGKTCQFCRSKE